jgi:MFS transporter, DHA2 family, multidrug resistance protein
MTSERGASPSASPSASRGTWVGFSAMTLGMFMAVLDIQIVVTSLPEISGALAIGADRMSWVQTAYLVAEVIAIPLTGLLTRVLSLRWLFVGALSLFTLASAGCAASMGFETLIVGRVVQGFAGGVLIPSVFSAVFLLFPFRQQGIAMTLGGVMAVLAPTVGPLVGGWITQTYSWHWLFLVNVLPGIAAAAVAAFFLPREAGELGHVRTIDLSGLVLMAVALAALEIGLKDAPKHGWVSLRVLGLLGLSLLAGFVFVRRSLGRLQPIVDLGALGDRNFAIGCWLSFTLGIGLYGSTYLMPVFLAFAREHGPIEIGRIILVTGIAQLLTAPIAVELERRVDGRLLMLGGFALFAAGLGWSAFQTWETDFDGMLVPQILRGSAIMFCLLPPTRLALGQFPPERVADASGLFNLMRNFGGAIGLALIDSVIYGRAPILAEAIGQRLKRGDVSVSPLVGIPPETVASATTRTIDAAMIETVRPLVERAGLVSAINEAWAMMAAITALALLVLPLVRVERAQTSIVR